MSLLGSADADSYRLGDGGHQSRRDGDPEGDLDTDADAVADADAAADGDSDADSDADADADAGGRTASSLEMALLRPTRSGAEKRCSSRNRSAPYSSATLKNGAWGSVTACVDFVDRHIQGCYHQPMVTAALLLPLLLAGPARAADNDLEAHEEFDPTPIPSQLWHDEPFQRELRRRRAFNAVVLASPLSLSLVGGAMSLKQCNEPTNGDKLGNDTCLFPVIYAPMVGVGVVALVLPFGTLRVQQTLEPLGGPSHTASKVGMLGVGAGLAVTILSAGRGAAYALPIGLTLGLAGGLGQGFENSRFIRNRGATGLAWQLSPQAGTEGVGLRVDGWY